jgi:UDP-N-acetylglucosamine 2-epimerase (non-hydrolysing)
MTRLEPILAEAKPDLLLVYGDVNSTVASSLVAAKMGIRVGHVEAGLRSFDRNMPEEINRLVTDQLSDLLFTPSSDADANLLREGIAREKIFFAGNVMIDSLRRLLPAAQEIPSNGWPERYALVTLHRPANVDDDGTFQAILGSLIEVSHELPVLFPAHPRTRQRIADLGADLGKVQVLDPLPYLEFLALQRRATVVITDSGGIQEETTYLGIPCLTVRDNTERPITLTLGTNVLVGRRSEKLRRELSNVLCGRTKKGSVPPLWDGRAGERIAAIVVAQLSGQPGGAALSAALSD